MRPFRSFALPTLLAFACVVTLAAARPAEAQDAATCLAKQLKLSSKACKKMAKCYVAVMKSGAGDAGACLDAAGAKLAQTLGKTESKGGCTVEDASVGNVGSMLSAASSAVGAALTLDGGKCAARKMGAFGKRCAGELKCNAAAAAAATGVDDACLDLAASVFAGAFVKAESGGGCATNGDAGEIATMAGATVQDTVDYLSGLIPTTTLTSTTTLPPVTTTLPPTTTTSTIPPPECALAADCPGEDTDCQQRTCTDGVCGFDNAPAETPCNPGKCNGSGNCVQCVTASDCSDPLATCNHWICHESGSCQVEADPAGPSAYQVSGDCLMSYCNGDGTVTALPDPTDPPCE